MNKILIQISEWKHSFLNWFAQAITISGVKKKIIDVLFVVSGLVFIVYLFNTIGMWIAIHFPAFETFLWMTFLGISSVIFLIILILFIIGIIMWVKEEE